MRRIAIAALCVACGTPSATSPSPPPSATPPARGDHPYQKGQLHLHSSNSGDSKTDPADVVRWYREHDFDFIVFTDHNFVTVMPEVSGPMLVIPGVELTQNLRTCDPPPTDDAGCLLHVNALFVTQPAPGALRFTPSDGHRLSLYRNAMDAAVKLGGIAQLNHPNFHWAADAALIAELVKGGLGLFEVANQSTDVANPGDATHPSTEALWDTVLTGGGHLFGVATDDAHFYYDADEARARGITPDVGNLGWVMVHARHDPAAIRDAIVRGDFYASNGVVLHRVEREGDAVAIEVADESPGEHEIVCIANGGREVARQRGRSARCPIADGGYVRATVTDGRGRQAWVQPMWRDK